MLNAVFAEIMPTVFLNFDLVGLTLLAHYFFGWRPANLRILPFIYASLSITEENLFIASFLNFCRIDISIAFLA